MRPARRMISVVLVGPGILGLAIVAALLALIPARRLYVGGYSSLVIGTYFVVVWLLAFLVAAGPARSRFFVPFLLLLYLVPFITLRAGIARLLGRDRGRARPPVRNVTPRSEGEGPSSGS
jgi:hypothetical protein